MAERRTERGVERSLAIKARGRWGEEQATRWYTQRGYQVLDRNWRCDAGELDLVVELADLVVFVEVKARASDRYGPAAAAVDDRKQRRLRVLAVRWLAEHPWCRGRVRFDVVAVTGTRLDVIEDAF